MNTFSHLNTSTTASHYSIPSSPSSDALDLTLQNEFRDLLWHETNCLDPNYGRHTSPEPDWVDIWSPKEFDSLQESSSQVPVDVGEEQDWGSAQALPPQEVLPPPEVVSLNPTVPGFSQRYENLERPPYEDRFYANVTVAEEAPAFSAIRRNLRSFPLSSGDIPTIPQPEGAFATLTTSSLSLSAGPMASENDHPFGQASSSSVLAIQRRAGLSNRRRPSSKPYDRNFASTLGREGEEASTSRRVLGPLPPQFVRDVSHSWTSPPFAYPTASSSLQAAKHQQDFLNSPTEGPTFQIDVQDPTTPPFPYSPGREHFGPLSEDNHPIASSIEIDTHGPFAVTPFAGSSSDTSLTKRDKSQKSSVIYKLMEVASLSAHQLGTLNAMQSTLPPGFALVEEETRQVVNELFRAEEDEMFFSTYDSLPDGTVTNRLGWYWCRWPGCSQHFYAKGEIRKHKTIHAMASDRLCSCKSLTPPCPCPRNHPYSDQRSAKRHAKREWAKWEKENNNH